MFVARDGRGRSAPQWHSAAICWIAGPEITVGGVQGGRDQRGTAQDWQGRAAAASVLGG